MESIESIKKTPGVLMTVPSSSRVEMPTKESVSLCGICLRDECLHYCLFRSIT